LILGYYFFEKRKKMAKKSTVFSKKAQVADFSIFLVIKN